MKAWKLIILLLPLGFLVSCGFQPLYSQSNNYLGSVKVASIDGRIGHFAEQKLNDKFSLNNENGKSALLETKIRTEFQYTSLSSNSYTKRAVLKVFADYELTIDGATSIKGSVKTDVGYDTSVTAYADIALLSDAEERAGAEVGNQIWFDIQHQLAALTK